MTLVWNQSVNKGRVVIIGRPNVGKSTLFNKLIRRRKSITLDVPGVTRDVIEHECDGFILLDTAGLDSKMSSLSDPSVTFKMKSLIDSSDQIIFVVEPEVIYTDIEVANWIRRNAKVPILLVVNKSDRKDQFDYSITDFDDTVFVSAEHSIGLEQIKDFMYKHELKEGSDLQHAKYMNIVICGQPNVGKSTIMNYLLQEERLITNDSPGTTRDSVTVKSKRHKNITLTDTAGLRKRSKVQGKIEYLSSNSALYSIKYADVILLVIDATCCMERQDAVIIDSAQEHLKPIVFLINKCDLIDNDDVFKRIRYQSSRVLPFGFKALKISALSGMNCGKIIECCREVFEASNTRLPSSKLNRWMNLAVLKHSPPMSHRKTPIRLKFVFQSRSSPIILKISANIPEDLPGHYISYLKKDFVEYFGLFGVPIGIDLIKSRNPYVE